jgi:biopolymer transport protein TolR
MARAKSNADFAGRKETPMSIDLNSPAKGGKKPLSADLNLVPYIDLLTCMVAFLLITAAWTQLAQLNVKQRGPGGDGDPTPPMTKIMLLVGDEGFNLTVGDERHWVPKQAGEYDFAALEHSLKQAKKNHPDKDDLEIAAEEKVIFGPLSHAMDVAIAAGFPLVSLTDTGAAGL